MSHPWLELICERRSEWRIEYHINVLQCINLCFLGTEQIYYAGVLVSIQMINPFECVSKVVLVQNNRTIKVVYATECYKCRHLYRVAIYMVVGVLIRFKSWEVCILADIYAKVVDQIYPRPPRATGFIFIIIIRMILSSDILLEYRI